MDKHSGISSFQIKQILCGILTFTPIPQSHCAIVVFLTDFLQFSYPYYTVF